MKIQRFVCLLLASICLLSTTAFAMTSLSGSQLGAVTQIGALDIQKVQGSEQTEIKTLPLPFTVRTNETNIPTLLSITPNSSEQGQTVNFTLTGERFTDISLIVFQLGEDEIESNNITVQSSLLLNGEILIPDDALIGDWKVFAYTKNGNISTGDLEYTIFEQGHTPPYVESMLPKSGPRGGAVPFILTGKNFREDAEVSFIRDLSIMNAVDIEVLSGTTLKGKIFLSPNAAIGTWNVTVTEDTIKSNDDVVFVVYDVPPTISKVWPNAAPKGNKVLVTLTGKNFQSGAILSLERLNSKVVATGVKILSATKLTGTFSLSNNTVIGTWDVVVKQKNLISNKNLKFTVTDNTPVVSSIDPVSGKRWKDVDFSIIGRNFKPGVTITLGKDGAVIRATDIKVKSSTLLSGNFLIPKDVTLGKWEVLARIGTQYSNRNIQFEIKR